MIGIEICEKAALTARENVEMEMRRMQEANESEESESNHNESCTKSSFEVLTGSIEEHLGSSESDSSTLNINDVTKIYCFLENDELMEKTVLPVLRRRAKPSKRASNNPDSNLKPCQIVTLDEDLCEKKDLRGWRHCGRREFQLPGQERSVLHKFEIVVDNTE